MGNVAVAMSGGVDSSVAAWLLQQQGHILRGLTMQLFAPCGDKSGVSDARAVADHIGFPHEVLDFGIEFRREVMDAFVDSYEAGQTPNPCITCNKTIKFGALLNCALDRGCDAMATGHYAQIEQDSGTGRYLLKKAVHPEKDQSYFLYTLSQQQLSHTLFPLGGLSKPEIREIAQTQKLVNATRGDSQDICFVPDGDYVSFIERHSKNKHPVGAFMTESGEVLGQHRGMICYTVGQRRGLAISSDQRLYVKELRGECNGVILAPDNALYSNVLTGSNLNLIATDKITAPIRVGARIRSRHGEQPATVEQTGEDTIRVVFDTPQRAIALGQAVVFYDGDIVIGGATITGIK